VQIKNGPQTLEVSKIRGKNKKNFEKCWSSIEMVIEISLLTKSGPQEGINK
jgi:hypothetical protein